MVFAYIEIIDTVDSPLVHTGCVAVSGVDLGKDRGDRPPKKIRWGAEALLSLQYLENVITQIFELGGTSPHISEFGGTAKFFSSPQTVDQVYATGYVALRRVAVSRGAARCQTR